MTEEKQECEKSEMLLSINAFDQPTETTGPKAWANLIKNLLFMVPGSIPSDPEMGCDIGQYEFMFIDEVIDDVQENIEKQIYTYLPDIPLESVSVQNGKDYGSPNILYITLVFNIEDVEDNITVVAAEKINSIINFAIV